MRIEYPIDKSLHEDLPVIRYSVVSEIQQEEAKSLSFCVTWQEFLYMFFIKAASLVNRAIFIN